MFYNKTPEHFLKKALIRPRVCFNISILMYNTKVQFIKRVTIVCLYCKYFPLKYSVKTICTKIPTFLSQSALSFLNQLKYKKLEKI